MGKRMIYTADTEEPDCGRCDNVTIGSDEYCAECGNGYWCHYKRTEYEGENEQKILNPQIGVSDSTRDFPK